MAEIESEQSESEESDVEWEDVEPTPSLLNASEPTVEQLAALKSIQDGGGPSGSSPKALAGSLEIVLERKANKTKEKDHLKKAIAAFNKEVRCNQHKVHLLCLVAHGLYLSRQCDNPINQALLLSLLGSQSKELILSNIAQYNQEAVLRLLKWISNKITSLHQILQESLAQDKGYQFMSEQVLVTLLRALGLRVRLVMVLNPVSYKESKPSSGSKRRSVDVSERKQCKSDSCKGKESVDRIESPKAGPSGVSVPDDSDGTDERRENVKGRKRRKNSVKKEEGLSLSPLSSRRPQRKTRRQSQTNTLKRQSASKSTASSKMSPYFKKRNGCGSTSLRSSTSNTEEKEEREVDVGSEDLTKKCSSGSDSEYVPEKEMPRERTKKRKLSKSLSSTNMEDSDDDFELPKKKSRRSSKSASATPSMKLKEVVEYTHEKSSTGETEPKAAKDNSKSSTSRRNSKATVCMSSGDNQSEYKQIRDTCSSEGVEIVRSEETGFWAEVYLTAEDGETRAEKETKKWTCVHLLSSSVGQPHLCEKHCTLPLNYVIAIENDYTVRDVTARYASNWCTHGHKQRLSNEWWDESLRPFEPSSQEERDAEEEDILSMLYAQPFPTAIADYKNHPLYALRRHLLKFEAIYPEESQILGYCKGEPVYARQCVHTLHTRETWLKEGRVVRVGEKAYKMVKARPKRGQSVLEASQNSTVEVFGKWQTEVYMAPPVVNGKVPRNEYGNIELFLPSMLPPGACHIKIQGIQKVARKLDIDYAPAMVGWDFHSGYCHPILNGIVVAEEYEEVLREAWHQQEQLLIEKDIKKREQRVMERWKKLTRGLLIRERVKKTYEMVNTAS